MKELVIAYEREHLDIVQRQFVRAPSAAVIALDYWVEKALRSRGITAEPLTAYVPLWSDFPDAVAQIQDLARQWYRLPECSAFQHHDLSLGEMAEPALDGYLQEVCGYAFLFDRILEKNPGVKKLSIPFSQRGASPTSGVFAPFQGRAAVDAARFCAQHHGIAFQSLGEPQSSARPVLFPQQSRMRMLSLYLYNRAVGLLAPRHAIKILVSDHWRNIKPVILRMKDAELVFIDRREIQRLSWRELWRHRIRFIHPLDLATPEIQRKARERQEVFRGMWKDAKEAVRALPQCTYRNMHWWPMVEPAFDSLLEFYAERMVADIESIRSLIVREEINRTLIRASISGQHHFFIMGELPRRLGIPSVEIQHGIGVGTIDPHSVFGRLHVDYIAAYGPVIRKAFVRKGYAPEHIVPTGSPRFDRYFTQRSGYSAHDRGKKVVALGLDPSRPVAMVVMPAENVGFALRSIDLTSYEFDAYMRSMRKLQQATPELQFIFKFRSSEHRAQYQAYIEELFTDGGVALEHGDAISFALLADFVFSSFSTLVCECLMVGKPVVLYPLKAGEPHFYEAHNEGVVNVPLVSPETDIPFQEVIEVTKKLIENKEFYAEQVARGQRYLKENFTVDGRAAEHVADLIRTVPPLPKETSVAE